MIARGRRGVHALRGVYRRFRTRSRIACPGVSGNGTARGPFARSRYGDVERGYEYCWEVGFGKRIHQVMSLEASVRSGDYEFGDAGSVAFVMTFSF
jgi:hypothetical protein